MSALMIETASRDKVRLQSASITGGGGLRTNFDPPPSPYARRKKSPIYNLLENIIRSGCFWIFSKAPFGFLTEVYDLDILKG